MKTITSVLVCLCALAAVGTASAFNEIPFGPQKLAAPGPEDPNFVFGADLDLDGDQDLISGGTSGLFWYKNQSGNGTFGSANKIGSDPLGSVFIAATVADINGDGRPDVVTVGNPFDIDGSNSHTAADVSVIWWESNPADMRGLWVPHGIGMFGGVDPEAGQWSLPDAVFAVDMNKDGDIDVVTGGYVSYVGSTEGQITWYENDPVSPWSGKVTVVADTITALTVADFDRDGDRDFVVGYQDKLEWLDNDLEVGGTITPRLLWNLPVGGVGSIFAFDMDQDGDLDVLTGSESGNRIYWYEDVFGDQATISQHEVLGATGGAPTLAVGDLNDIEGLEIVAAYHDGYLGWFRFYSGLWYQHSISTSLLNGNAAGVADLDQDGDLDVLAAAEETGDPGSANKIIWHENRMIHRNAIFPTPINVGPGSFDAAYAAEADGDGINDAFAGNVFGDVDWWKTVHDPDFSFLAMPAITDSAVGTTSVSGADLDHDGDQDLFAAGDGLRVFENTDGAGTYSAQGIINPSGITFHQAKAADIDADGEYEIITAGEEYVLNSQPTTVVVWRRSGGTWRDSVAAPPAAADLGKSLAIADIDRDGDKDILVGGNRGSSGYLWWAENAGVTPLSLSIGQDVALPDAVEAVAVGDLDKDGDLDAVVGLGELIQWYENTDGAGTFDYDENQDHGGELYRGVHADIGQVAVGDLDKDGDLDVAAVARLANRVLWFENLNGKGESWTEHEIKIGGSPNGVFLADFELDGDLDTLVASDAQGLEYYANLGGQYTRSARNVAPENLFEGQSHPMLELTYTLHARPGDSAGELAVMRLIFETSPTVPLDNAVANALIERVQIYRDDGSGEFEEGADILVHTLEELTLVDGVERVALADDDKNLRIAAPATFFVVVSIAADAVAQATDFFSVRDGNGTVEDASADLPLLPTPAQQLYDPPTSRVNAPIHVDTFDDGLIVDSLTSLREAIIQANDQAGPDKIILPGGDYILSDVGPDEDLAVTGDLDITDTVLGGKLDIEGSPGVKTTIDGNGIDRVFHVLAGANLQLAWVTVRGGSAPDGGGIRNDGGTLSLTHTTVTQNTATGGMGGGIFSTGQLILDASIVSDNSVTAVGGGGGGIYIVADGSIKGVTGWNSTISGNDVPNGTGGGLYIAGTGSGEFWRTTFSGNSAASAGGLFVQSIFDLTGCTVTRNEATGSGGGIEFAGEGGTQYFNLGQTIVAGNIASGSAPDCYTSGSGSIQSQGQVLIGNNTDCSLLSDFGDWIGTPAAPLDPMLVPLADNGGFTPTHALVPGSPAVDQADCVSPEMDSDQRGERRPVDLPDAANYSDGCDIGAYELKLAETLPWIEVPVRWCVLRGAATFGDNPDQAEVNRVLRERHETASDKIWDPQSRVRFRSAANDNIRDFPILDDPFYPDGPAERIGVRGDIYIDPTTLNFAEFKQAIADCRAAWQALDPTIVGITAVQINQFVDSTGQPSQILGLGGRAEPAHPANPTNRNQILQQMSAGRVMVIDGVYRAAANPPDLEEVGLAHELGHAVSLQHGNGKDDDDDGIVDNNDDQFLQLPRFDGPNVMQYRDGTLLTMEQAEQFRNHVLVTIPDIDADPSIDALADSTVEQEWADIMEFEWADLLEFLSTGPVDPEWADLFEFLGQSGVDGEWADLFEFLEDGALDPEWADLFEFGWGDIVDYGIQFDGTTGSDNTTVFASTGGMPWPSPILPDTSYLFYLDLDDDANTGGDPSEHGFPSTTQVAQQGIDIVVRIQMSGDCSSSPCTVELTLAVFEYDTSISPADYVEVYTDVAQIEPISVSLYQDTGGAEPVHEEQPLGVNLSATIPNQVLQNAGWQVGTPVTMQVVTSVPCVTTLPNGTVGDCQCLNCGLCPSYPGCYEDGSGTPEKQGGCSESENPCSTNEPLETECGGGTDTCVFGDLIADEASGVVDFDQPVFPLCTVEPSPVGQDRIVTIKPRHFPTLPDPVFEVRMGSAGATTPSFTYENGDVLITETVPVDAATGDLRIAVVLQGFATAAHCYVCNDPDGTDFDNDGLCDVTDVDKDNDGQVDTQDTDDDNDGVPDVDDSSPSDPFHCGLDSDSDGCDDCSGGSNDPENDGCGYDPIVGEIDGPVDPVPLGAEVTVNASFSDPDAEDTYSVSWAWGDGTTETTSIPAGVRTVTANHTYNEAGVYTVDLTITDNLGGVGGAFFQYVVIYDPSAGFVTGGGWIDSLAGAYALDPTLTGRANFGFVSKYKKGASLPSGNTEFKFHAANLDFHSDDYQWLVVAGPKAQFKGDGTINGTGNYGFIVFAIDAALTPSTDVDLFRIKIWNKDDGDAVVYDNEFGGSDDADATTQIGGGSIVIHKPKGKT